MGRDSNPRIVSPANCLALRLSDRSVSARQTSQRIIPRSFSATARRVGSNAMFSTAPRINDSSTCLRIQPQQQLIFSALSTSPTIRFTFSATGGSLEGGSAELAPPTFVANPALLGRPAHPPLLPSPLPFFPVARDQV